jgi:hypothetical protein
MGFLKPATKQKKIVRSIRACSKVLFYGSKPKNNNKISCEFVFMKKKSKLPWYVFSASVKARRLVLWK